MADLDVPGIAAAALRVADQRGAEGFTMRAVADELGVTAMALYHHVEDKAALAALVIDEALREHPLPAITDDDWQDQLWELARWTRARGLARPYLARLRREHRVWTPSVFAVAERWLTLWQRSGLEFADATRAAATSNLAIVAIVDEEMAITSMTAPDPSLLADAPKLRAAMANQRYTEAEFELLVRSLVEGLHTRLSGRPGPARKPSRRRST